MTLLQSLALKLVMLAVTVSIVYWSLENDQPQPLSPVLVSRSTARIPIPAESPSTRSAASIAASVADVSAKTAPVTKVTEAASRRPLTFPINLNAAKLEDFMELPGIGETLAGRMIAYRRAHGKFQSVEDLRHVKGIGKKRMDRLRPLVMTTAQ